VVTRYEPSGRFSYRPGPKAWLSLDEAIRRGELTEDGELVDPHADLGSVPPDRFTDDDGTSPDPDHDDAPHDDAETSAKPVDEVS